MTFEEMDFNMPAPVRPPEWSKIGPKGRALLDELIRQELYIPNLTPANEYNLQTARDHVNRTGQTSVALEKRMVERRAKRARQPH